MKQHYGEISLAGTLNALVRHRKAVLIIPVTLVLVVAVFTIVKSPKYTASAEFVPERQSRIAPAASQLARQFGIGLGSEGATQSPFFYASLLESRSILRPVVERAYELGDGSRPNLIELYDVTDNRRGPAWRKAVEKVKQNLRIRTDFETSVVKLEFTASSPGLATQVLEEMLHQLNTFNLVTRQSHAAAEAKFATERLEQARLELQEAEAALATFLRTNRRFSESPDLTFEHERLQRNVLLRQEVLVSLAQMAEQARIDAARDVPIITVIDRPAEVRRPRGLVIRVLLALILGGTLAILWVLARERTRDAPLWDVASMTPWIVHRPSMAKQAHNAD